MTRTQGVGIDIHSPEHAAMMICIAQDESYAVHCDTGLPANCMQGSDENLKRLHALLLAPHMAGGKPAEGRLRLAPAHDRGEREMYEILTHTLWRIPDPTFEREGSELFVRGRKKDECSIQAFVSDEMKPLCFRVRYTFGEVDSIHKKDIVLRLHDELCRRMTHIMPVQLLRPSLSGDCYTDETNWQNPVPAEVAEMIARYEYLRAWWMKKSKPGSPPSQREDWCNRYGRLPIIGGLEI